MCDKSVKILNSVFEFKSKLHSFQKIGIKMQMSFFCSKIQIFLIGIKFNFLPQTMILDRISRISAGTNIVELIFEGIFGLLHKHISVKR